MTLYAPAKTFLIGEYVATTGGPAIVLATQPSFSLKIDDRVTGLVNIHPDSPAGKWYEQQDIKPAGLVFTDPYQGMGGMGASSAQFVLVYQAVKNWLHQTYNARSLLADYFLCAWHGKGIRPSGYDVLTQFARHNLFIDEHGEKQLNLNWPFVDYSAMLIHTGNKLATHIHLAKHQQPSINKLKPIVSQALIAWQKKDVHGLAKAIQEYYLELTKQNLVAPHTADLVQQLRQLPGVLAVKGCGAMGADVLLLMVENNLSAPIQDAIEEKGLTMITKVESF